MYYTIFSSALFSFRMAKAYSTIAVLSAALLFSSSASSADAQASVVGNGQCVILLHGLARTSHSMDKMEQALIDGGYTTANIDYPSRSMKIQDLTALAMNEGVNDCQSKDATAIHLVTHSMGGILARYYLAKNKLPKFGHLVQLAPPNQGSLVTDQFRKEQWYKWVTGPAGQQLGTGKDGVPGLLGAVDFSTGVIAGNEHSPLDNWLAEVIPGEDDGKVSVSHAKVEGMADFIVLPYTHISIMKQVEVIAQTLHFLKHGNFNHPG
jgi:pimeloyl-ACP methyl ester carboxylesterase